MEITYEEWRTRFKPVTEDYNKDDAREMDMTGTSELAHALMHTPAHVWTLIEVDDPDEDECYTVISSGYHRVNRLEHYICAVACTEHIHVIDD